MACLLGACPTRSPADRNLDRADADADASGAGRVVIFVGDGMGRGQLDAASLFAHGEREALFLYTLPVHGTVASASPSGITDSAAAATAMATGTFTYNGRIGRDRDGNDVQNLLELAQSRGAATGLVTTTRLAHATPAGFAAHADGRNEYQNIAAQVAELRPDVLLGGGRNDFSSREDGRDLASELRDDGYRFVEDEDALAEAQRDGAVKLVGMFAGGDIPYVRDRDEHVPTLAQMTLAALDIVDRNPDGFVLLVEGGRIDHASHANDLGRAIEETLEFDEAVQAAYQWSADRTDLTILVTADHETGGLQVSGESPAGELPSATWRWGNHTNGLVQFFGQGPGTEHFDGRYRDHRWIHAVASARLLGTSVRAPAPSVLPDGNLQELVGPSVVQTRDSDDGSLRIDRLAVGADEYGLGIGLEGHFRWDRGAVVIAIDVDHQADTGPSALSNLADGGPSVLELLSTSSSPDDLFGAELVAVSSHGEDPRLYDSPAESGLFWISPSGLARRKIAVNFADGTRGNDQDVQADRGLEAFVPWQELGFTDRPSGLVIALWALLVEDDGVPTNQSLPPWSELPAEPDAPLLYTLP